SMGNRRRASAYKHGSLTMKPPPSMRRLRSCPSHIMALLLSVPANTHTNWQRSSGSVIDFVGGVIYIDERGWYRLDFSLRKAISRAFGGKWKAYKELNRRGCNLKSGSWRW